MHEGFVDTQPLDEDLKPPAYSETSPVKEFKPVSAIDEAPEYNQPDAVTEVEEAPVKIPTKSKDQLESEIKYKRQLVARQEESDDDVEMYLDDYEMAIIKR